VPHAAAAPQCEYPADSAAAPHTAADAYRLGAPDSGTPTIVEK
jgi:hypothetical protein